MTELSSLIKMFPAIVKCPWGHEKWLVSARPEAQSLVYHGGNHINFGTFLKMCGKEVMGPQWTSNSIFPVLGKILECKEDLSVQVHPSAAAVQKFGGEPKEEFWYVVNHDPEAKVFVGFEDYATKKAFKKAIVNGDPERYLHELPVYKNACMFIPGGRAHCIGGGVEIFEMQQSSDTTFRVWDYNRLGLDGKPRDLHIREALESMNFRDIAPSFENAGRAINGDPLVACDSFRVTKHYLGEYTLLNIPAENQPRLVHVIRGGVMCSRTAVFLEEGESGLIPYGVELSLEAEEVGALLLITDNFFI